SGTPEASTTGELRSGASALGPVTADGSGNWSYDTAALSDAAHSFTVTSTDAAGNSATSAAFAVTVDTVIAPPTIDAFADDSGTPGDHITNDNTLHLTGTAEAGSSVEVKDGAAVLGTVTADGSGNWSYDTAALSDAAHSFTVTSTDAAGNSATSAAFAVTVDTVIAPPTIDAFADDSGTTSEERRVGKKRQLPGSPEAGS